MDTAKKAATPIEVEWQDYETAVPPAKDSPFTENQIRYMWRERHNNGVADTGVLVMAAGKIQLVRKRIPSWYEHENKNHESKNQAA